MDEKMNADKLAQALRLLVTAHEEVLGDGMTSFTEPVELRRAKQALAEYDAQPAQAAQQVRVPDEWVMVPMELTPAMLGAMGDAWDAQLMKRLMNGCTYPDESVCETGERVAYRAALAAAPQPPAQPSADAEDGFTEWLDKDWPLWITNPDNPNVARLRRAWIAARTKEGDGNE